MVKERRIALAALTAGTALALSWTPALAIAAEVDGPVAAVERVGSTANLPKTNEFHKVTNRVRRTRSSPPMPLPAKNSASCT